MKPDFPYPGCFRQETGREVSVLAQPVALGLADPTAEPG
jgi:hypothetical protein